MKEYIIKIGDEPDIMGNYPLKEEAKELVRCKDCKHCMGYGWCNLTRKTHERDWFCADGETVERK